MKIQRVYMQGTKDEVSSSDQKNSRSENRFP
jgi:hypothetical protein